MTQLEKEQLAPDYWNLVKVWKNNSNDVSIPELENKLTKEEKSYFEFMKGADYIINQIKTQHSK